MSKIKLILTDIEGTTTSIAFVHDVLFPYFLNNINLLSNHLSNPEVQNAFEQTKVIAAQEGIILHDSDTIISQLEEWALEDRKVTPLKNLQGILWKTAYESGTITGHIYSDVVPALTHWKSLGIDLAIFSSGSIAAQRLLFGYSDFGDLNPYFLHNFDTTTGGKKETTTYTKIAAMLALKPEEILFLSDIVEELEAASEAGLETQQLIRPGTVANWNRTASNFGEVILPQ